MVVRDVGRNVDEWSSFGIKMNVPASMQSPGLGALRYKAQGYADTRIETAKHTCV